MTLQEFYQQVGGDYPLMVKRMINDKFATKCIKKLLADTSFQDFVDNYQQRDYEKAFLGAHSLKGVCANLGIQSLLVHISELSNYLKYHQDMVDDEYISNLITNVKSEYTNVIECVKMLDEI